MAVCFEIAKLSVCFGVSCVVVALSENILLETLALIGKIGGLLALHTHWTFLKQICLVGLILESN